MIIVDWLPDGSRETVRRMGVAFAFTYPGEGIILLQTGYFERDLVTGWTFTAGPHDLFEGTSPPLRGPRTDRTAHVKDYAAVDAHRGAHAAMDG